MRNKFLAYSLCAMLLMTGCGQNNRGAAEESSIDVVTSEFAGEGEVSSEDESTEEETKEQVSYKYTEYAGLSAEEIVAKLTLEQRSFLEFGISEHSIISPIISCIFWNSSIVISSLSITSGFSSLKHG